MGICNLQCRQEVSEYPGCIQGFIKVYKKNKLMKKNRIKQIISRIRVYPLKNRCTFPQTIAVTHERPEFVSWNASSVHMVELTIPLTGAENTGAMKQIRNTELVDSGTQYSYQATLTTVELKLVQERSFIFPVYHKWTQ